MLSESSGERLNLYIGSLVGLAVGDALGTTLEFQKPGTFIPIHDMVGGGPFGLLPGQWTDDTSMALCLAESLIECQGFQAKDQMDRYVKWYQTGYLSSTGQCFDIGNATREALDLYIEKGNPFCGRKEKEWAGNGSLMRLAPIPLYFASYPEVVMRYCVKNSKTTHATQECIDACKLLGALIMGAVRKVSKEELLSDFYHPIKGYWDIKILTPKIAAIASGSYKRKNPPEIKGTGYVVDSLEAALWAFYHANSFEEGALMAVNLGDDADTTGAVYGQLAGAFYGVEAIPLAWRETLSHYSTIEDLATKLYDQSASIYWEVPEIPERIIYDRYINGSQKKFRLYFANATYNKPSFVFYVFDKEEQLLEKETIILSSTSCSVDRRLQMIKEIYPEIEKFVDELYKKWAAYKQR